MRTFTQDASDSLDYEFDWSVWLQAGETITASTVTVDAGLTLGSSSNNGTAVTVWLSGGAAGQRYTVTNRITTSASRQIERSFLLQVTER